MVVERDDSQDCWKTDWSLSKGKNYICSVSYRIVLYLSSIFSFLTLAGQGQDLLVRIYGDTIHCKIDKEDERFVYYRTKNSNRGETEIISRKEVREILYGWENSTNLKIAPKKIAKEYETIQVSVQAGYSLIMTIDDLYGDEFESVYEEVREGVFVDVRANYFLSKEVGLGMLYSVSQYNTNSSVPVLVNLPSGVDLVGDLSHDRELKYYALNLAYRLENNKSNMSFQFDLGFGLLAFEDEGEFIDSYQLSSGSLGGHFSAAFKLGLGEGFYLPALISLKGFRLTEFEFNPSAEMNSELALGLQGLYNNLEGGINANRIQFGLGLGFAF